MASAAQQTVDVDVERFSIDRRDERLIGPTGPIKLGNKAFQLLVQLVEAGGRLVTKDALMSSVWDGTIVSEFSLTSAVKELRRALRDDARAPRFIESVYGRGYRLLRPIDVAEAPPASEGFSRWSTDARAGPGRPPSRRSEQDAARPAGGRGPASSGQLSRWFGSGLISLGMVLGTALSLASGAPDRAGGIGVFTSTAGAIAAPAGMS